MNFLPKLFDVASPNWESDIKRDKLKSKEEREEDLRFLFDQRGERKEWLGNYSKHYSKALKAKEKRQQQVEKQKEKEEIRKDVTGNNPQEIDPSTDNENNEDYYIPIKKTRKSDTVTLEMPRDIIGAPGISNMLDRTKISNRFAVGNLATFIKAGGGNLNDINPSKSSICNKRNKNQNIEYEKLYNDF